MNLNELAKEVTKYEGKKVQINISQVKEVLKVLCRICFWNPVLLCRMYQRGEQLEAKEFKRGRVQKQHRNIRL